MNTSLRIDKWLWAARFFKTRNLASNAIALGRVLQNEQRIKPAHHVNIGDLLTIHQAEQIWQVQVLKLLEVRGSAQIAQTMYAETADSLHKRQQQAENRRYQQEPAAQITERPTKRQRRLLSNIHLE